MAKSPSSKKKIPSPKKKKGAKIKKDKLGQTLKALEGVRHVQYFGQLNEDGTPEIDLDELKKLKKKLEKKGISTGQVRFVALNAPFKRRSQDLPT